MTKFSCILPSNFSLSVLSSYHLTIFLWFTSGEMRTYALLKAVFLRTDWRIEKKN